MNKTKAFSKAAVIIAMVLSLTGCFLLPHILTSSQAQRLNTNNATASSAAPSSQPSTQQSATPASTAHDEPSKSIADEEVTGNNITQEIQFMNQGQQGATIVMPHAG